MCCVKENFSHFSEGVLKEVHFSDVSSQNDKPAKCICIILDMFYRKYFLNVESLLIFLSSKSSETKLYSAGFCCCCCCFYCCGKFLVSFPLLQLYRMLDGKCLKVDLSPEVCLLDQWVIF